MKEESALFYLNAPVSQRSTLRRSIYTASARTFGFRSFREDDCVERRREPVDRTSWRERTSLRASARPELVLSWQSLMRLMRLIGNLLHRHRSVCIIQARVPLHNINAMTWLLPLALDPAGRTHQEQTSRTLRESDGPAHACCAHIRYRYCMVQISNTQSRILHLGAARQHAHIVHIARIRRVAARPVAPLRVHRALRPAHTRRSARPAPQICFLKNGDNSRAVGPAQHARAPEVARAARRGRRARARRHAVDRLGRVDVPAVVREERSHGGVLPSRVLLMQGRQHSIIERSIGETHSGSLVCVSMWSVEWRRRRKGGAYGEDGDGW